MCRLTFLYVCNIKILLIKKLYLWMYFATLLKTTAPVKLPISQLSLIYPCRKIRYNLSNNKFSL